MDIKFRLDLKQNFRPRYKHLHFNAHFCCVEIFSHSFRSEKRKKIVFFLEISHKSIARKKTFVYFFANEIPHCFRLGKKLSLCP